MTFWLWFSGGAAVYLAVGFAILVVLCRMSGDDHLGVWNVVFCAFWPLILAAMILFLLLAGG